MGDVYKRQILWVYQELQENKTDLASEINQHLRIHWTGSMLSNSIYFVSTEEFSSLTFLAPFWTTALIISTQEIINIDSQFDSFCPLGHPLFFLRLTSSELPKFWHFQKKKS